MKRYIPLFALLSSAIIFSSCRSDSPVQGSDNSSFGKLQEKVLTKCAGCHTENTDYALQSGLILDADNSYQNLVGVPSHYSTAKTDGLLLVKPGNADSSFLYIKIHGFPPSKKYGLFMPLGFTPLTLGQQEFIREWINAGAPRTGIVADAKLLDDTTSSPLSPFTALPPPDPGTGFQVSSGKFDVPSNFEREIFIYKDLGNPTPIYVNHIHTKMRPDSHHEVLYIYDPSTPQGIVPPLNSMRDLRNFNGSYNFSEETLMNWRIFVGGSMIQEDDYNFPPGVALRLPAHAGIDLNTHFINYTQSTIPGECYANLYTVDSNTVQHKALAVFIPDTTINLPPHQQTVVSQTTLNQYPVTLQFIMLTSHYHSHGQKFQIVIAGGKRNGEVIYESSDWSQPLEKIYDPPITINPGEGLTTNVTYFNNTDATIRYGLKSTDEMDVLYGYFYY